MGKVTQAVFGTMSSSMTTNLMAAGVTGAGASQAGDMMQDLKTGSVNSRSLHALKMELHFLMRVVMRYLSW